MKEATFTFYAIYKNGLYWSNLARYGGRWSSRPRLWSRKSDAKQSMSAHKHDVAWLHAIIIPMEVSPLAVSNLKVEIIWKEERGEQGS